MEYTARTPLVITPIMSKLKLPVQAIRPILPAWFDTAAGQALLAEQIKALKGLIPDQFYQVGLQYGLTTKPLLARLNVELAVYCDRIHHDDTCTNVVAVPEALPLSVGSVDLALLLHTLDYCDDPHHALREISQVMSPEGIIVLTGFHPISLWGARRKIGAKTAPFDARFLARSQVQDWLELLGFQSVAGCMVNYQFSKLPPHWREKLKFMNKMGDRWWPTMGAVYMLVVKKKVYSGLRTPLRKPAGKWFPKAQPTPAKISQQNRSLKSSR